MRTVKQKLCRMLTDPLNFDSDWDKDSLHNALYAARSTYSQLHANIPINVLIGRLPNRKMTEEEISALSPAEISSGKFTKPIDIPKEENMNEIYIKMREDRLLLQKRVKEAIQINQARYEASYDRK